MKPWAIVKELFKWAGAEFWSTIKSVWTEYIRPYLIDQLKERLKRVMENDFDWSTFITDEERVQIKEIGTKIREILSPPPTPATQIGDAA